jgi:hypothetical protein
MGPLTTVSSIWYTRNSSFKPFHGLPIPFYAIVKQLFYILLIVVWLANSNETATFRKGCLMAKKAMKRFETQISSGVYYMYNVRTIVHELSICVYCIVSITEPKQYHWKGGKIASIIKRSLLNSYCWRKIACGQYGII